MDIRKASILETLQELHEQASVLSCDMLNAYTSQIEDVEKDIYPGIVVNCGEAILNISEASFVKNGSASDLVDYIHKTLGEFKSKHGLDDIIVVNLASTEPAVVYV